VNENEVFRQIVESYNPNYKVDSHSVTTEDGYILKLFRIRGDGTERPRLGEGRPKPVVFFQHGLISSSETFVNNGRNSLPFRLIEKGYDVWLGNNRGNIYCRKHIKYTTDDHQFWDFSFYELGKYDLPAMIDHVRQ